MAVLIDKAKIIEAIQNTDDERVLFAINRLLLIEEDVPQWHIEVLKERVAAVEKGDVIFNDWEDVNKMLFKNAE